VKNSLEPFDNCNPFTDDIVTEQPIDSLCNLLIPARKFMYSNQDRGIDAIMVARHDDNSIKVQALQIKLGKKGKAITHGNFEKDFEARRKSKQDHELSVIVAKAEHGWKSLLTVLKRRYSGVLYTTYLKNCKPTSST
jgi:hypothetical protein